MAAKTWRRVRRAGRAAQNGPGDGSVDDALRPQIGGLRAARRPEEMLSAALHTAVEGALIREVEVRQPWLPVRAEEGGGDRVGFAIVFPPWQRSTRRCPRPRSAPRTAP